MSLCKCESENEKRGGTETCLKMNIFQHPVKWRRGFVTMVLHWYQSWHTSRSFTFFFVLKNKSFIYSTSTFNWILMFYFDALGIQFYIIIVCLFSGHILSLCYFLQKNFRGIDNSLLLLLYFDKWRGGQWFNRRDMRKCKNLPIGSTLALMVDQSQSWNAQFFMQFHFTWKSFIIPKFQH